MLPFRGNVLKRCLSPKGLLHRRGTGTSQWSFIAVEGLQHSCLRFLREGLWAPKSSLHELWIHR